MYVRVVYASLALPPCFSFLSDSRSSYSEGQLVGSFSDGELLRLTPGGRNALEDGELPPGPPPPPPPPPPQGAPGSQAEIAGGGGGSSCSAGRSWTRGGDPRQHLTLLMSAHPRLRTNRGSASGGGRSKASAAVGTAGTTSITATRGVSGVSGGRQQGSTRSRELFLGPVRNKDFGTPRGARLQPSARARGGGFPEAIGSFGAGDGGRDDDDDADVGSSLSDNSGCSLEPGQACPNPPTRRSWQSRFSHASAGNVGVDIRGGGGGSGQIGRGPSWLRQPQVPSEDTASSAGETSSGAEVGETLPTAVFLEEGLDGLFGEGGGWESQGGGGGDRALRPLVALKIGAGASDRGR